MMIKQMIDWTKYRHLSKEMNWTQPEKMSLEFMAILDEFLVFLGFPIILTSTYREGDTKTHGKGIAVDIMAGKEKDISTLDFYILAEKFGKFNGVGLYPHWSLDINRKDIQPKGGLHIDIRDSPRARWIAIIQKEKQAYIALNEHNIKEHIL
jgi:hypothetical protein